MGVGSNVREGQLYELCECVSVCMCECLSVCVSVCLCVCVSLGHVMCICSFIMCMLQQLIAVDSLSPAGLRRDSAVCRPVYQDDGEYLQGQS